MKHRRCSRGMVGVMSLVLIATAHAQERTTSATREGNVWGVNLGWEPGWDTTGTVRLLGLARHLVGEWGYLRHGISPAADVEQVRRSMAMIRSHHLIPIAGKAYPDKRFYEAGKTYPHLDEDGTMRTAARHAAQVWRQMYEARIPFYAVEVMNEINIGDGWPAEKYARWLYDYAIAVKQAYPGLKVCSCGMAGSGADYYDEMLTFLPELEQVVDFWGCHPYGANHPPEYKPEGTSLRSYEETIDVLEKHGVEPIRLMCTETGYELEMSDTGKDPKYPPIREENRAEYMARAFRDYYVPEPKIDVVAVFQLWDFPWHNWNGWDLMYHDGRPRPIYEAMAAEPKSGGNDWLPTGPGRINGRITWRDTDIGVPRVIVYVEPGLYGGVTGDDGRFEIVDLPLGDYAIAAFRDGFTDVPRHVISLRQRETATFDARMRRVSLVPGDFGAPADQIEASTAPGWSPFDLTASMESYAIDETVPFRGRNTQRISLEPDESAGLVRYGGYSSAYPGEVTLAEIHVRSTDGRCEPGDGPYLELALTNGRGEPTSTAHAYAPDFKPDGTWHRITAALYGPARSTRVRVAFGVEDASGTFWFSEPFAGEADLPVPTDVDAGYRTTGYVPPQYALNRRFFAQRPPAPLEDLHPDRPTATCRGTVKDFRGRPLARATVATDAPLLCTLTDEEGQYALQVPASGRMRVRAFALGETPDVSEPFGLESGELHTLDLQTAPPDAPPELVNGDFEIYHPEEPGLMTGWTGFGTTDGTYEATHDKIVVYEKPFAHQGRGLYFAQSGSNTKNGGAYQIVQATPGRRYRLTGWVFTYAHGEAKKPMDNNCQLGIDPTGGRDPDSPDVVWTDKTESEEKWTRIEVAATAGTERITVFMRHEMRRGNYWNLTMFDDVQLVKAE